MKLTLVIATLGGGGAERVMSRLANAWAARGESVTLITIGDTQSDVYPLAPSVRRVGLDLLQPSGSPVKAIINNGRRLRALRRAIRESEADVVLSFMTQTNILTAFATRGLRQPVVVAERISVADQPPRGGWNLLFRFAYRRVNAVVAQTRAAAAWLEIRLGVPVRDIPNPLPENVVQKIALNESAEGGEKSARRVLLAMGRLHIQKGFDLLLEAFAEVANDLPDWDLLILGEGKERDNIENLAKKLGLAERVKMPGFRKDSQRALAAADAFVLSSRYEGMPNALMEAMASGLPCISFDCATGPAELIQDGINGLLVSTGDTKAMSSALSRIMSNTGLRDKLSSAALEISTRYGLNAVLAQWDAVFKLVLEDSDYGHDGPQRIGYGKSKLRRMRSVGKHENKSDV